MICTGNDQIQENEMGGACGTCGGGLRSEVYTGFFTWKHTRNGRLGKF